MLQKVEELGLFEDTVVVFTTDHGMFLGEHNRTGKSNIHPEDERIWPLYEELAHIPLMIAAPGIKGGCRVKELTQPVELLPTLMDLCGVEKKGLELHGHSLQPLMQGTKKGWPRKYAFSSPFIRQGGPVVTDKRWSYVSYGEKGGEPELYDLKEDPGQRQNLIRQRPDVARRMRQALEDFLKEVGMPEENYELIGPVGGPDYEAER